jgi:hypothetical protein
MARGRIVSLMTGMTQHRTAPGCLLRPGGTCPEHLEIGRLRRRGLSGESALMQSFLAGLFVLLPLAASAGQVQAPTRAALDYAGYAVGLHILSVESYLGLGPWNYQVDVRFNTTGLAGLFNRGHEFATVRGGWRDDRAAPGRYESQGEWRGTARHAVIDYGTRPEVRTLLPPGPRDREPVPPALQAGSTDLLSALATLVRHVTETGACETAARVYDGRTLSIFATRSAGWQTLPPTDRSSFAGPALRCDFQGRVAAGFLAGHEPDTKRPPLRGSIWLARALPPPSPPVPVRIGIDTRWFGEVTLYLTRASPASGGYEQANSRN